MQNNGFGGLRQHISKRKIPNHLGARYVEKQCAAHCGMHAFNNIVEARQFSLQLMEEACQNVFAETGEETSVHKSPSGDRSLSVLDRVLELTVPPVLKLVTRPVIAGDWDEFVQSKDIRGILVNANQALGCIDKSWTARIPCGFTALATSHHRT